jgi:hypothetical protein
MWLAGFMLQNRTMAITRTFLFFITRECSQMKRLISIAVMVSVLAVTGLASAYSIQLREVGVNNSATINATFGNFDPSNPPSQIQGSYDVLAGYYQLQINGASPVSGFCVDPAWAPTSSQTYDLRAIDSNSVYAKAAYLFSLSNANNAAAVQIAIWQTVMGGDFIWDNANGALPGTVSGLLAQLNNIPGTFDLSQ